MESQFYIALEVLPVFQQVETQNIGFNIQGSSTVVFPSLSPYLRGIQL